MSENTNELILDLLIKSAVEGLTPEEARHLAELEAAAGPSADRASIEETVAMLSMAGLETDQPLPAHIEARIADAADEYFQSIATSADRTADSVSAGADRNTRESGSNWFNWLGWLTAAAACIALAANIYVTRRPDDIAAKPSPATQQQEKPTPQQLRQRLIESAPDIARAELSGGKGFEHVGGDAVWSDQQQAGYLRFRNLPVNDKSKETYQLWIFDETQPEKTPIDGGTFDINSEGEVVIPIDAKLAARRPKAFAVTVEKPGGVVVSDRSKVAAIGKTSA